MFEGIEIFLENSDVLQHLTTRSDVVIIILDNDANLLNWNSGFNKISGFTNEEILSEKNYELVIDEDSEIFIFPSKYGGYIHIPLLSVNATTDMQAGYIGIKFPDAPPILQKCRYLVKQTNLYDAILRSVNEGIITLDENLKITFFSPKAEQMLGFKSNDIVGKQCSILLSTENCEQKCPVKQSISLQKSIELEDTEMRKSNGNVLKISKKIVPLTDSKNKTIGALVLINESTEKYEPISTTEYMGIIGASSEIRKIFTIIKQISDSDVTVLITGESGTGKELVAKAIHKTSNRKKHIFQALNCAALPENLLESELFGHIKGAFTGAIQNRAGYIETAEDGTLFLDEIGELSLNMQVKLLRFLQEREFQRVGESKTRKSNVRIICATNKDLQKEVNLGNFREDLYYRIKVVPVHMPPLRERKEDIPLLANHFLKIATKRHNKEKMQFSHETIYILKEYKWYGNIRELINIVEYCVVLTAGNTIHPSDLPKDIENPFQSIPVIVPPVVSEHKPITDEKLTEKEKIEQILQQTNYNKTKTAQILGINRSTLYRKMKFYNIQLHT